MEGLPCLSMTPSPSESKKQENAGTPVVYRYDELPKTFREQVVQILRGAIGPSQAPARPMRRSFDTQFFESQNGQWELLHDTLAMEMGVPCLVERMPPQRYGYAEVCFRFLREHMDIDQVLSLIELSFRVVEAKRGNRYRAIAELNRRFREHSIGYQYQGRQIVRVDSLYLHHEVVEPAITLLRDAGFQGALQEFMVAHRHYREQKYKEAITASGNAFESAMKTICDKRGWDYNPKRATASALIETLFNNDLIPSELKNHFNSLRVALESGLPTVRNQAGRGAHGQGATPIDVPDYLVAYCLHLAAANIVLLIEAHNAKV